MRFVLKCDYLKCYRLVCTHSRVTNDEYVENRSDDLYKRPHEIEEHKQIPTAQVFLGGLAELFL